MRFYHRQTALDYDRRLAAEGYPGMLLEAVLNALEGGGSVIDVGAGTGFFTVPLADMGYLVHAVEPSPEMLALLRGKLSPETAARVIPHQCSWEEWRGGRADSLICVHSIYPMENPRDAVVKMARAADRTVMVVRADEGIRSMTGLVREVYRGNRCSATSITDVRRILEDLNIEYTAAVVVEERTVVIPDLDEEAEYYCRHLSLGEDAREGIRRIIKENSETADGRFVFRSVLKDWVIVFQRPVGA